MIEMERDREIMIDRVRFSWAQVAVRRSLAVLLAAAFCARTCPPAAAQAPAVTESQIKALCLFNFAKFTAWPDEAFPAQKSPLVIGIAGEADFQPLLLELVKGETINGRKLELFQVRNPSDIDRCQILFVAASEKDRLPQLFQNISSPHLLTVGETEDFATRYGIVGFTLHREKRIEINYDRAKKAGLRISARIMKLARLIYETPERKR